LCLLVNYLERMKKIKKHLNQNKQTLERSLNLTSQSAKQSSHPLQRDDRWFVKFLSKFGFTFWTSNIPLLLSQTHFFGVVFPTIWKVLLRHLCQSDIFPVSSNGGWSKPRKLFFAGFLNNISARTTLCSLAILVTSIRCVKIPD